MTKRGKNILLVAILLVAAGLAAALIAVSALGGKDSEPASVVHGATATEQLLEGIPQDGNVLGRPDAPVTIVEYADYQCPYCAQWATSTLPALVDEYVRPGKVRMVFQGIAILGPDSVTALQAATSAGTQDRLWNYGELLFHSQGAENSGWVTEDLLRDIGEAVPGLDVDAMMDGRDSPEATSAMADAQSAAQAAGIAVTPSFQIGRTGGSMMALEGARPAEDFRRVLDRLLEE